MRLGLLLRESQRRAAVALNAALAPLGLGGRHFGVLLLIARDGVSTQRDLVRETGSDKTGMVRTVEDLAQLGYLDRTPSTMDRRVAELTLTDEGRAVFKRAREVAASTAQALTREFTEDELSTLISLLDKFTEAGPGPGPGPVAPATREG